MKRFTIATSNAQKLKELDVQARTAGTRAVAVSTSGSLYVWDGKPVKANPDDVATILNLPLDEVLKWLEAKGDYEFEEADAEPAQEEEEEVKTVAEIEEVEEIIPEKSIVTPEEQENESMSFIEVKEDYVEAVHDEKVYEVLVEIGDALKASNQRVEDILKALKANILE